MFNILESTFQVWSKNVKRLVEELLQTMTDAIVIRHVKDYWFVCVIYAGEERTFYGNRSDYYFAKLLKKTMERNIRERPREFSIKGYFKNSRPLDSMLLNKAGEANNA